MQAKNAYDRFISHVTADEDWVKGYPLVALDAGSVQYTREETFRLGVPRLNEFESSVRQSKHTLFVLTSAYLANDDTQFVDRLGAAAIG